MVCTTVTVIELAPVIAIIEKGLTVDGSNPTSCIVAAVGKPLGFYLKLTLVFSRNQTANVVIPFTTPTGTKSVTYSSLFVDVGTVEYYLGTSAEVYVAGTTTIGTVQISNIRDR